LFATISVCQQHYGETVKPLSLNIQNRQSVALRSYRLICHVAYIATVVIGVNFYKAARLEPPPPLFKLIGFRASESPSFLSHATPIMKLSSVVFLCEYKPIARADVDDIAFSSSLFSDKVDNTDGLNQLQMDAFGCMVQGSFLTRMYSVGYHNRRSSCSSSRNRTGKPYAAHLARLDYLLIYLPTQV